MASFHGKDGKVEWNATAGGGSPEIELDLCLNWTCNVTADLAEITKMSDTYKGYVAGVNDWTATVTCNLDSAGTRVPISAGGTYEAIGEITPAYLELWLDHAGGAGNVLYVYGLAVCTGFTVNEPSDALPTITYDFQGLNTLTQATTEYDYP